MPLGCPGQLGETEGGVCDPLDLSLAQGAVERLHYVGGVLAALLHSDLPDSLLLRPCFLIWPVADHGVEAVGDGDDGGAERYLFSAETVRIAGPVPPLVVPAGDLARCLQPGMGRQQLLSP